MTQNVSLVSLNCNGYDKKNNLSNNKSTTLQKYATVHNLTQSDRDSVLEKPEKLEYCKRKPVGSEIIY